MPNCLILSDALNHNSVIEASARHCEKQILRHGAPGAAIAHRRGEGTLAKAFDCVSGYVAGSTT
jgi:7-keto-8-aminopelargonate synthetase-like enzyme